MDDEITFERRSYKKNKSKAVLNRFSVLFFDYVLKG